MKARTAGGGVGDNYISLLGLASLVRSSREEINRLHLRGYIPGMRNSIKRSLRFAVQVGTCSQVGFAPPLPRYVPSFIRRMRSALLALIIDVHRVMPILALARSATGQQCNVYRVLIYTAAARTDL